MRKKIKKNFISFEFSVKVALFELALVVEMSRCFVTVIFTDGFEKSVN